MKLKVIIGIPAYNEEKNIAGLMVRLGRFSKDILVCDDGSTDSTGEIAERMGATVISHGKNRGYGSAIRSLFLKARELEPDVLITFDGDGQHRVEDLETVARPIKDGQADVVIGSRFLNLEEEGIPAYRKAGIKMITKLANTSLDEKVTDSQSGFRAYSRKALERITPSESGMGVSNEILMKASKCGFKTAEVPITVSYEGQTSTHHPVSHGVGVVLSTMKFISLEHPLKFYGIPGISFLGVGLFFILWTLQLFAETRTIITNVSLIGIGTIILGTMLLMSGIILYSMINLIREKND